MYSTVLALKVLHLYFAKSKVEESDAEYLSCTLVQKEVKHWYISVISEYVSNIS